jgi:rare lipoprotein A
VPLSDPAAPARLIPIATADAPRYVLEDAWQGNGVWFYPKENFSLDQTGIAAVQPASHAARTTDNEAYDPFAMMAAMQEVQLPAIAIVTNLDNGRQAMVRVNDRGPADPHRLIALSPGAADVLGIDRAARVRVQFDPAMSLALARQVQGHAADLPIDTAPVGQVHEVSLALLSGTRQEAPRRLAATPAPAAGGAAQPVRVPDRPPEDFEQTAPDPGPLMIAAGTFTHQDAAQLRLAALGGGARLIRVADGHATNFDVETGP